MMLCHKDLLNTGNVNFPSGWKVLDPQVPKRLPQCGSPFPDPVKVYEIIWGYMQAAVLAWRGLLCLVVSKCPKKRSCRIPIRRLCLIPWQFFVDWLLRQRHKSYFHQWVTWPWKVTKVMGQTGENQRINFEILRFATFAPWNLPQFLGRTRLSPFWRAH